MKRKRKNVSSRRNSIFLIIAGVLCIFTNQFAVGLFLIVLGIVLKPKSQKKTQAQEPESEPDFNITVEIKPDNTHLEQLAQRRTESVNDPIETFEQSKKKYFPSNNGLYPAEILLIEYCKNGTYPIESQDYPGFWWYRYGVHDVNLLLDSLERRHFICLCSAEDILPNLTVTRLKELLSFYHLPLSGKKMELVQRLKDNVPDSQLTKQLPKRKYKPTHIGLYEVEQNGYVPYLHRALFPSVDMQCINKLVFQNPLKSWQTILWEEFENRKEQALRDKNYSSYSSYRSICLNQYYFANAESTKEDAFRFLAETMYLDLNRELFTLDEIEEKHCIAPGLVKYLADLRNQLSYNEPMMKEILISIFSEMKYKNCYLTDSETAEIITAYVFGHPETIKKP